MTTAFPGQALTGHHHVTIGVGDVQEDFDFHTKVLGLKVVKRTLFYDGDVPVYHLYYGNDLGEESTLITTFPMGHTGVRAKEGSGQCSYISLSVPTFALAYWKDRLQSFDFDVVETERFGEPCLDFRSPHNIRIVMTGIDGDGRAPRTNGPVPAENMIRGTHASGVSTRDMEFMSEFLEVAWGSRKVAADRNLVRYEMGDGGTGTYMDFEIEPDRKPGSWTVGEGAIHHMAFNCPSREAQKKIKFFVEGLGYTDFSDIKNRGYFDSIYIRTPSGALFEATVTHEQGFLCNEPVETLGTQLMMSPQIEANKEEVLAVMGSIRD